MADINSIHDIARSIIECMDMESYSELPEEEHYMYLEKDLIECESKCPISVIVAANGEDL